MSFEEELLLFAFSILLSSFYSGSEAALVSISAMRAKQLIEEGGSIGNSLRFMVDRSNEVLTTILIGNNLVNIFAASLSTSIASRYFEDDALAYSVGITTFFILIFGEIIPKVVARGNAEKIIVPILMILRVNYVLFFPAVWPFSILIHRLLGKNAKLRSRLVTKSDIEFLVSEAEKGRSMDSKQIDLLTSILEFPTIKVKDIMVPRHKVSYLRLGQSSPELIRFLKKHNHSRYPVCDGSLDKVVGLLHIKDLAFITEQQKKDLDLEKYIKPPFFVYEQMKIQLVFDYMNRKKIHMALVRDENAMVV